MGSIEQERVRASLRRRLFGASVEPVRVGRYELVSRIGRGGMSVVYEALDPELRRRVAIKVVSSSGHEHQERLLREGAALASVSHPHVVSVFDIGVASGDVYLVLELVDGENLTAWLAAEKRSWNDVLDVMIPAAEGLAAAHAVGLVHRDVTPRNIVVDRRRVVRVVDFGLVQPPEEPEDEPLLAAAALHLTQTGALLGTPPYMAPEQWLRGTIDSRTDQFGYCASLFEALYGRRPFHGGDHEELKQAITTGALDTTETGAVPSWLRDIVVRGLSVDPTARHESMQVLIDAVAKCRNSLSQTTNVELKLSQLRTLLAGSAQDEVAIDRVGIEGRASADAALDAWPDNADAVRLREELLTLLIDHECSRGNGDAAARLLSDMKSPPADLTARVDAMRSRDVLEKARLQKLDRIERAADVNVEPDGKFRVMLLGASVQTLVFLAFGVLTRFDVHTFGTLETGLFYACYLVPQLASERVASGIMRANDANRRFSAFGAVAVAAHAALFLLAYGLQVATATTFVLGYVMSTALWSVVAVSVDRRASILPPVTIVAGIATLLWPRLCFEIHALAAAFGIGGVAFAMRSKVADPSGLVEI